MLEFSRVFSSLHIGGWLFSDEDVRGVCSAGYWAWVELHNASGRIIAGFWRLLSRLLSRPVHSCSRMNAHLCHNALYQISDTADLDKTSLVLPPNFARPLSIEPTLSFLFLSVSFSFLSVFFLPFSLSLLSSPWILSQSLERSSYLWYGLPISTLPSLK